MIRHSSHLRAATGQAAAGFTGIELLVTVVILGVLAAIGVSASLVELRAARVDAAANEFAGWLEAVRRAAERGIPCDVEIKPQTAALPAGPTTTVATATPTATTIPNNCLSASPFRIDSGRPIDRYAVTPSTATFTFTPRGSLFLAVNAPVTISFQAVENGSAVGSTRCVRLNPPLGLIDVGACP
jgi:prepilin-type N-terminal cleavage/methylation domain-containing protein